MKLKITGLLLLCAATFSSAWAQKNAIERVEPEFWWTGFDDPVVQLLVYGKDIGSARASLNYPGVTLERQIVVDSPNYLFLYLNISDEAQPGSFEISFKKGRRTHKHTYELKARSNDPGRAQGFNSSDAIYLLMPDRFANGDPSNDYVEGMLERPDRNLPRARHGGDLAGIQSKLGYLDDLGFTAIWMTPVFENDMPDTYRGYHGYAATDMYKVDRRFGSNDEFKTLVDEAHKRGMKVIMDMIHNHIGDQHWWMKDLPTKDWVHDLKKDGLTNYVASTISDPYASEHDLNRMENGWFVTEMPDMNQKNELLARYLIQNTLWWIEFAGVDGIRMDTFPYAQKDYMARWVATVHHEYPNFNIVGETWVNWVGMEAYWHRNFGASKDGYNSNLRSVTDFPIHYAIVDGMKNGLRNFYNVLAQDYLYYEPKNNVIFLDNHDLERFHWLVGSSKERFKLGFALLSTMRGIPQYYYGTELMMTGDKTPTDATIRPDFPGGWVGDERDAFTREGRTEVENEVFDYVRTILQWRRNSDLVHSGKTTHFIPQDDVYVFFRHNDAGESVMVILNRNQNEYSLNTARFSERLEGFSSGREIIGGTTISDLSKIAVPGQSAMIIELAR